MPSDTPFEIDFASLKSQAADMIDKPDALPSLDVAPVVDTTTPTPDPVVADKVPDVTTLPTADELDPELHGDRLVKVKVDGQWEVKPLKEIANGYSRTSHFTRQMQDLATQRKQVEGYQTEYARLQAEQTQLRTFLNNPQAVYQFLQQSAPALFEQAQQPLQGDPDEIATVQQARQLVDYQASQMQQRMQQMEAQMNVKLQQTTQEIENRRETAVYIDTLNSTVKDIFEKNPILSKVRLAEDIIRYEVAKMNPRTIVEAQEAFRTVAQGMVEDLDSGYAATSKTKVAAKAKLDSARIEPPGGSGPQIQPTQSYKRPDGTLDWNKLKQAAADFVA